MMPFKSMLSLVLAGSALAVLAAEDLSILETRNVFDANLRGSSSHGTASSSNSSRVVVPVAGQATLRLSGLWVADGAATAILESGRGEATVLVAGTELGQWKVSEITAEHLLLVAGETRLELKPGMALVASGDGQWLPSATAVAPASASGSAAPAASAAAPAKGAGGSREEILKRLKERRQQENK